MNRPHTLAFVSERFLFIAALLSAIVLILSAGALVYAIPRSSAFC